MHNGMYVEKTTEFIRGNKFAKLTIYFTFILFVLYFLFSAFVIFPSVLRLLQLRYTQYIIKRRRLSLTEERVRLLQLLDKPEDKDNTAEGYFWLHETDQKQMKKIEYFQDAVISLKARLAELLPDHQDSKYDTYLRDYESSEQLTVLEELRSKFEKIKVLRKKYRNIIVNIISLVESNILGISSVKKRHGANKRQQNRAKKRPSKARRESTFRMAYETFATETEDVVDKNAWTAIKDKDDEIRKKLE